MKPLVFLAACLAIPVAAFSQSSSPLAIVLTPPVDKYIQVVSCKDSSGSWQCIMKNKTNSAIDMHMFFATGFDKDGVKEGAFTLMEDIEAGGSSRISLSRLGYAGNVSRVVITVKQ